MRDDFNHVSKSKNGREEINISRFIKCGHLIFWFSLYKLDDTKYSGSKNFTSAIRLGDDIN